MTSCSPKDNLERHHVELLRAGEHDSQVRLPYLSSGLLGRKGLVTAVTTMDEAYANLAARIWEVASARAPKRILVGMAGPPGSGKTTIAAKVLGLLNSELGKPAVAIPMDGFHYTRAQLDAFPDPTEAHKRRGAPWTFNVDAVLALAHLLHTSTLVDAEHRKDILAPSFDHAIKDPIPDDICIPAAASIVILEGNYLLLDEPKWRDIGPQLDFRILVHVAHDEARARIAQRHVLSGIEANLELSQKRFDSNDGPNGNLIRSKIVSTDIVVESVQA
jgi:pantothenate kinase